jgi:hypothetical protein
MTTNKNITQFTEFDKKLLYDELEKIESLNQILISFKSKSTNLQNELSSLNTNLPEIVEKNNAIAFARAKNQDFLAYYSQEIDNIKQEQDTIILQLRQKATEKAKTLLLTDKYKNIEKKDHLSKSDLLEYIIQELIAQDTKEIEIYK